MNDGTIDAELYAVIMREHKRLSRENPLHRLVILADMDKHGMATGYHFEREYQGDFEKFARDLYATR